MAGGNMGSIDSPGSVGPFSNQLAPASIETGPRPIPSIYLSKYLEFPPNAKRDRWVATAKRFSAAPIQLGRMVLSMRSLSAVGDHRKADFSEHMPEEKQVD